MDRTKVRRFFDKHTVLSVYTAVVVTMVLGLLIAEVMH